MRAASLSALVVLGLASCSPEYAPWHDDRVWAPPAEFAVSVRGPEGPLAGAKVYFSYDCISPRDVPGVSSDSRDRLRLAMHDSDACEVATTDSAGLSRVSLPAESCKLDVECIGFVDSAAEVLPREPLEVKLERDCPVQVRVVDEWSRPTSADFSARPGVVVPIGRGMYQVRGFRRGDRFEVSVNMRPFLVDSAYANWPVVAGDEPVNLRLPVGGLISVRTARPGRRDEPADHVSLRLEHLVEGTWLATDLCKREVDTGHDVVRLEAVPLDTYRVVARVPGHGCGVSDAFAVSERDLKVSLRVMLHAGRTVTGRVIDREGNHLHATVKLSAEDPDSLGATTGDDGSFTFTDAPLGDTSLSVSAAGYETTEIPLAASETYPTVTLVEK